MKKLLLLFAMLASCACTPVSANGADRPAADSVVTLRASAEAAISLPNESATTPIIDRAHAQDWSSDINNGWLVQQGDNPGWATPGFDDSAWRPADLDDLGPSHPGWRWYRLHLRLHENHPDLALLIQGGEGTYTLYVNGIQAPGPQLRSSLGVIRPAERVLPLDAQGTDLVLALRTHAPPAYANWHLPLFLGASLGTPDAMEIRRQALESNRLNSALPAIAINLLLIFGGLAAFALKRTQPKQSEYLWLGLYLFLLGWEDLLWGCQLNGFLPLSLNFLVADPLIYLFTIAQIEFTYSFGNRRVPLAWRIYEALLLVPLTLIGLEWQGRLPSTIYLLIEGSIVLPVALLLPILLLVWYRRGNREAGWLILPSLLPAASVTQSDLGTTAIFLGWHRLDFLNDSIPIGALQAQAADLCSLLFLIAIAVVMFFRFTRVSRDQARTAAELSAAREIQQRLVPATLPEFSGFHLEAAYLPAQEVGGDFYQVLAQQDGYALIVVGDVSGKGLKAAMTGALAIGALRTLAAENLAPAVLLTRLNLQMLATQESGFITCLCVRMSPRGEVTVANAGHLSPYRRGEEIAIDAGLPLGLTAGAEYIETVLELAPGDTLTLLSDGILEATDSKGELLGFARMAALTEQSATAIAAAAQHWGQEDDITVLTVSRTQLSSAL